MHGPPLLQKMKPDEIRESDYPDDDARWPVSQTWVHEL